MTGLRYSPLHVIELCGEKGKFIVGRAQLIKKWLKMLLKRMQIIKLIDCKDDSVKKIER